jgi:hypothetical protein
MKRMEDMESEYGETHQKREQPRVGLHALMMIQPNFSISTIVLRVRVHVGCR